MGGKEKEELRVDEDLYSRQLYVIGHEGMKKMMRSRVLIIGLDGLGQEVAKNVCLAGIRRVGLFDKSQVQEKDLGAGFYFSIEDIGKGKDEVAEKRLSKLNKYVNVEVVSEVSPKEWDLVVSCNQIWDDNLRLNDFLHEEKVKFILVNVSGLFFQLFVDFGEEHLCVDRTGNPLCSGSINDITGDGVLTLADGNRHTLEDGDIIKVKSGSYKIKVLGKSALKLEGYSEEKVVYGGDFEQVHQSFPMKFMRLREAVEDDKSIITFEDILRTKSIHELFTNDGEYYCRKTEGSKKVKEEESDKKKDLQEKFKRTRGALIAPMCSIGGGIGAQEVIKGITGKFVPFKQFFYFDQADFFRLPEVKENFSLGRYTDIVRVFGEEGLKTLQGLRVFLVGAGAIGCENMKNFVMTGIGSSGKGKISITDMDSVEQSNLNRQFLFSECDIGHLKSEAAVKRAAELNETYNKSSLISFNTPVGSNSEDVFSDQFLSGVDVICNALDNVEARNYVDNRCVILRIPLVDAGTLGTKGHVQSIVPFKTESYRSTVDSTESSVPMCTIKTFPSTIEHTIEWALGVFESKFKNEPERVHAYIQGRNEDVSPQEESPKSEEEIEDPVLSSQSLFEEAPRNIEGCIKAALDLFVHLFSTSIQRLLSTFPSDYITKEGFSFWSPPKRAPSPLSFNINDRIHILFVESAANLFAATYGIRKITRTEIFKYLENLLSLKEPNPIHFDDTPSDLSNITPLTFDKDSWHADFVYTCSNLRARNYAIKEQSKHFIRGVAGKIIPAIATTTALVSGISTLEIIKLFLSPNNDSNLSSKNTFIDLGLPLVAQVDTVPPKSYSYPLADGQVAHYTLWSRLEFTDRPLGEIISAIEKRIGKKVSMVSVGSRIVFWDSVAKHAANLSIPVSELCQKKPGQLVQLLDIIPDDEDMVIEDVAVVF